MGFSLSPALFGQNSSVYDTERRKLKRKRREVPQLAVEGLYYKRPIQCPASSEILTPHRPASVYPPPVVQGKDTLAGWRGGLGSIVWKTPDTALYSIYVSKLSGGGGLVEPNDQQKDMVFFTTVVSWVQSTTRGAINVFSTPHMTQTPTRFCIDTTRHPPFKESIRKHAPFVCVWGGGRYGDGNVCLGRSKTVLLRQIDRQIDKQIDRQIDRQIDTEQCGGNGEWGGALRYCSVQQPNLLWLNLCTVYKYTVQ